MCGDIAANSAHSYSTAGGTMFGSVLMVLATLGSASLQEPDLRSWLEVHAGLEGKRLQAAVELCETEDIGTVGELREVHDSGRFGALGFKPVSAGRIEQALAAVAPYERRRAQDGASATCNPDIARLEARLDAVTAIQYVNMFPVPPTRNPRMPLNHPHLFSYTVSGCPRSSARSRSHSDSA
jgi:hypothetical protein